MSIFSHAMQPGGMEKPPKGLTPQQKAEWFSETFDDLPDGAFFALAEEMGIDLMYEAEGTPDHPDVTDEGEQDEQAE